MANKFHCHCGAKACLKDIKGFKYLTLAQKKSLQSLLSPFLQRKLQEEEKQL